MCRVSLERVPSDYRSSCEYQWFVFPTEQREKYFDPSIMEDIQFRSFVLQGIGQPSSFSSACCVFPLGRKDL